MSAYSIATRGLAGRKIPQGVLAPINTLLFGSSEQGAWYDPADLSTLFQDTAGTTPVTAVEQAVALMLDKSGRGNHAIQATSTKRPVLSARVNLFQKSQADAAWIGAGSTPPVVANNVSYLGESCATTTFTPGSNLGYGGSRSGSIGIGGTIGNIIAGTAYSAKFNVSLSRPLTGSEAITLFCTGSSGLGSITINVANSSAFVGKFAEAKSAKATPAISGIVSPYCYLTVGVSSDLVVYINKCSLFAGDVPNLPYQWVNTPTDYDADPAKFPAYLRFDGIDDAMQTGNIDFTGTDKMTVWAGVTKLSDAMAGVLLESSANANANSGSFYITAPESPGVGSFAFKSRGTATVPVVNLFGNTAPLSCVVAALGDIAGDITSLRVNGVATTGIADQGTGNYGNYPLYIGARAGTSLYFNGRLYSLIVRGAQSSLSQIEATENLIRQKMRLP